MSEACIPANATYDQIYWYLVGQGYQAKKAKERAWAILRARAEQSKSAQTQLYCPPLFDLLAYDTSTPLLQIKQGELL